MISGLSNAQHLLPSRFCTAPGSSHTCQSRFNLCLTSRFLTLLVRVHPLVGRDRARLGQFDHPHRRCVAPLPTRPALQRGFQLPDRRIPRPADGVQRQARPGLVAIALHLEPAQTAAKTLTDRWRWLGWAALALHADRPGFRLRSISFPSGLLRGFPGALGADIGSHDAATPDYLSAFRAHAGAFSACLVRVCMPLGLEVGDA